jgi:hypothetical protein
MSENRNKISLDCPFNFSPDFFLCLKCVLLSCGSLPASCHVSIWKKHASHYNECCFVQSFMYCLQQSAVVFIFFLNPKQLIHFWKVRGFLRLKLINKQKGFHLFHDKNVLKVSTESLRKQVALGVKKIQNFMLISGLKQ